jgi:hypothetical protein
MQRRSVSEHPAAAALQSWHGQRKPELRRRSHHVHLCGPTASLGVGCTRIIDQRKCDPTGDPDMDGRLYRFLFHCGCWGCWRSCYFIQCWQRHGGQNHVQVYQRTDSCHQRGSKPQFLPWFWHVSRGRRHLCLNFHRDWHLFHSVAAHACPCRWRRRCWSWIQWSRCSHRHQRHALSLLFWICGFQWRWRRRW